MKNKKYLVLNNKLYPNVVEMDGTMINDPHSPFYGCCTFPMNTDGIIPDLSIHKIEVEDFENIKKEYGII